MWLLIIPIWNPGYEFGFYHLRNEAAMKKDHIRKIIILYDNIIYSSFALAQKKKKSGKIPLET